MIFGANLGFHQRESNSRQNCRGKSMELDFEARSATFEETLDALSWIFPASSEKIDQKFKQCLEHLCFRACFCAKRAKLGWCSSFCPSFKVANFLRNKEGGKGGHVHNVAVALGNLTFEAEMSLRGTVVGPRGAPRTCTLGRGTHPTHSIDLGGGAALRATLPPDSAPISSTLDLPFPVWEVGKSAWTQSPLRDSAQHVSNEKSNIN